ncbi:hypothetical protein, partial [Cylindrospermopsis raciborskii]|uniref:hypothetical protein n=1 Tax=Cylindrospermopsis raciborskii TaxID=77022 RepID=UPI0026F348D8
LQLLDMGDDPRCMVGYSNWVKWFFFVPVIFAAAFSLVAMMVVMCNLQAPALRKRSLVLDHSNLVKGVFVLVSDQIICRGFLECTVHGSACIRHLKEKSQLVSKSGCKYR